jgi:hypothetical protein
MPGKKEGEGAISKYVESLGRVVIFSIWLLETSRVYWIFERVGSRLLKSLMKNPQEFRLSLYIQYITGLFQ